MSLTDLAMVMEMNPVLLKRNLARLGIPLLKLGNGKYMVLLDSFAQRLRSADGVIQQ